MRFIRKYLILLFFNIFGLIFLNGAFALNSNLNSELDILNEKMIEINGFLTTSASISNATDYTVPILNTVTQPTYDSIENKTLFTPYTVAGLQFFFPFQDNLSAAIQFLGEGRREYRAKISWAYIKWEANQNFSVIFGRMRMPSFLLSDYINVGYAYPWVQPPSEVYSRALSNLSGILPTITGTFKEEWNCTLQPVWAADDDVVDIAGAPVKTQIRNLWGAVGKISNDIITLRSSFMANKITLLGIGDILANVYSNRDISGGFGLLVDQNLLKDSLNLSLRNKRVIFIGLGAQIDYKNWLFWCEYIKQKIKNSSIGGYLTYYCTLGYKWRSITPNFTYSVIRSTQREDHQIFKNINPAVSPQQAFINGVAEGLFDLNQDSYILGFRYDINENVAFKLSNTLVNIRKRTNTQGKGLFSVRPNKKKVNIVSLSVDMVF